MAYWWVNHKQTYVQETQGGYLWSPKTRQDGSRSQFYENMTKVQPDDIVFSYANAQIRDVGVAITSAMAAAKPSEFGAAGDNWSEEGWLVRVDFQRTRKALRPKDQITQIAPLLPEKYAPIQPNGNGNQTAYLTFISDDLGQLLISFLNDPELEALLSDIRRELREEQIERGIRDLPDVPETDKEQLVRSRRGQGVFRRELEKIETCCRVTRLSEKSHLRASHIKPWRNGTNRERLDGNNGLLLAPHIDHLFDRGYLTFTDDGEVLVSSGLTPKARVALGVEPAQRVGGFNAEQSAYLAYHREHIFLG